MFILDALISSISVCLLIVCEVESDSVEIIVEFTLDMLRKTFFSKNWLAPDAKDNNGDILSDWCTDVKLDPHSAHCKVCHKTFSIANQCDFRFDLFFSFSFPVIFSF